MRPSTGNIAPVPLSALQAGTQVCVDYLDDAIDPTQREQLTAYGLAPDQPLVVLQQRPMTIVMIDQLELALETSVVRHVWVHPMPAPQRPFEHVISSRAAHRPARRHFLSGLSPVIVVLTCVIEKAKHVLLIGRDGS
ncbi:MAG: ferrous iron transport protein A [Burkholderiaceae bacterium]|nr:ferrous iron transport protein A [Burkholderiaceae bacterium]